MTYEEIAEAHPPSSPEEIKSRESKFIEYLQLHPLKENATDEERLERLRLAGEFSSLLTL